MPSEKDTFEKRVDRCVGARIAAARKASMPPATQQDLADRTNHALTRSALASIELGRQSIAIHQLYVIARALRIEPAVLLPALSDVDDTTAQPPEVEAWLNKLVHPRSRGIGVRKRNAKPKADRATGS